MMLLKNLELCHSLQIPIFHYKTTACSETYKLIQTIKGYAGARDRTRDQTDVLPNQSARGTPLAEGLMGGSPVCQVPALYEVCNKRLKSSCPLGMSNNYVIPHPSLHLPSRSPLRLNKHKGTIKTNIEIN